jgi:hypothetical protein
LSDSGLTNKKPSSFSALKITEKNKIDINCFEIMEIGRSFQSSTTSLFIIVYGAFESYDHLTANIVVRYHDISSETMNLRGNSSSSRSPKQMLFLSALRGAFCSDNVSSMR